MGLFSKKTIASIARPLSIKELRKRTKIVVIDDDKDAFPTQALNEEGYTIEYWPEVKSIDRLEEGGFDIIVLDISGVAKKIASEEDGFDVLRHLKSHNPAQIIVAFSGQSFDLSKQEFFKLADDTMPKPVTIIKCKQVLDQLIESKMTIRHLWESIATLMRNEGIPEKKIKRFEESIVKQASLGNKLDYSSIVSSAVDKGELATKVISLLTKIGAMIFP